MGTPSRFSVAAASFEVAKDLSVGGDAVVDRTVDSHIRNLRRKLVEAGVSADPIETVFGVGYRLGLVTGYDERLVSWAEHTPILPFEVLSEQLGRPPEQIVKLKQLEG